MPLTSAKVKKRKSWRILLRILLRLPLRYVIRTFIIACPAQSFFLKGTDIRQERLYLFQFPSPFPTFVSNNRAEPIVVDTPDFKSSPTRHVSFADVEPLNVGSGPSSS